MKKANKAVEATPLRSVPHLRRSVKNMRFTRTLAWISIAVFTVAVVITGTFWIRSWTRSDWIMLSAGDSGYLGLTSENGSVIFEVAEGAYIFADGSTFDWASE